MASSSSTTKSFSMANFLLTTRSDVVCDKSGRRDWSGRQFLTGIEDFANLAQKNVFGEGVVKKMGARIENAVARDEAVRIAGHVENTHARLTGKQVFGEDTAVHPRHDDIVEDQVERALDLGGDVQTA